MVHNSQDQPAWLGSENEIAAEQKWAAGSKTSACQQAGAWGLLGRMSAEVAIGGGASPAAGTPAPAGDVSKASHHGSWHSLSARWPPAACADQRLRCAHLSWVSGQPPISASSSASLGTSGKPSPAPESSSCIAPAVPWPAPCCAACGWARLAACSCVPAWRSAAARYASCCQAEPPAVTGAAHWAGAGGAVLSLIKWAAPGWPMLQCSVGRGCTGGGAAACSAWNRHCAGSWVARLGCPGGASVAAEPSEKPPGAAEGMAGGGPSACSTRYPCTARTAGVGGHVGPKRCVLLLGSRHQGQQQKGSYPGHLRHNVAVPQQMDRLCLCHRPSQRPSLGRS